MYIVDLTSLIRSPRDANNPNVFYCNNCLLHWKENFYIMTYRRIEFHTTVDDCFHPWKIWDNSYKYLYPDPERMYLCVDSTRRHGDYKYRQRLSPDRVIVFDANPPTQHVPEGLREFDGTGLAILRYTPDDPSGSWHVVHNIENVFGDDMNQDARLCYGYSTNEFFITYNSFLVQDTQKRVVMMTRRFHIIEKADFPIYLYFFEEEELLHHPHRAVEKNCIRHTHNEVLYSISDGRFCIHKNTHVTHPKSPLLERLDKLFRPHGILFSLGSNTMAYNDNYLALGHLKIPFRSVMKSASCPDFVRSFLEGIDWDSVYAHGKYIYMMIIFEFDGDGRIRRISNAFIPTESRSRHLPYLLCFPVGITHGRNDEEILISYGEGDVRCKIWSLTRDNMENLLFTEEEFSDMLIGNDVEDFQFRLQFLDIDEFDKKPKIFHFGYYFEQNVGDDMFAVVFRSLQRTFAPDCVTRFRNTFHPREIKDKDTVLFGGGDIITSYFINDLIRWASPHKKHAISIGVPFNAFFTYLEHFNTTILRNPLDTGRVREMFPKKCVEYFPDLGFLLPRLYRKNILESMIEKDPGTVAVGVSIPRTSYQKNSLDYIGFLESIVSVLTHLLDHDDRIHLYLIPFCIRANKHTENDRVLNTQLQELLAFRFKDRIHNIDYDQWGTGNFMYVKKIYTIVSQMDFMICGRFHSHVFAMASGVPFLSLSWTRKCHELMKGYGLADYMIRLHTNTDDRPIRIRCLPSVQERLITVYTNMDTIRDKIKKVYDTEIDPRCSEFLKFWETFMHQCIDHNKNDPRDLPVS